MIHPLVQSKPDYYGYAIGIFGKEEFFYDNRVQYLILMYHQFGNHLAAVNTLQEVSSALHKRDARDAVRFNNLVRR